MLPSKEYEHSIPGLADAAAACRLGEGHKTLVLALRLVPGLEQIKLATTRGEEGGSYLATRSVFSPDGARLHDDHEVWLRQQVEADDGNVRATYNRLSGKGFKLSKTHVATLYFTVDQGGDESNFTQIELWREDERMDCELLNGWSTPLDVDDIVRVGAGAKVSPSWSVFGRRQHACFQGEAWQPPAPARTHRLQTTAVAG